LRGLLPTYYASHRFDPQVTQQIRNWIKYSKGVVMNGKKGLIILSAIFVIAASSGCSTPLSTREKGAGIGALGGATAGGLIGAAVGHPAAGAAIGGALGLGAGALVGDQLQGQEQTQYRQQQQIDQNQAEIQRQRQQIDQLKRRQEY
jgi:phage tail tape-measure protein